MFYSKPQATADDFKEEIRELFFLRSHICLWLAVVFFSLFSILDFLYAKEHFKLFLLYRMVYVTLLLGVMNILRFPLVKQLTPHIIMACLLFGAFTIALMCISLGGFYSGYYVGILLMIAGAFSVLPLRATHACTLGVFMYYIYIATVLLGTGNTDKAHLIYGANNSFFFLSLIGVTAVQSYDDFNTRIRELRAKTSLQNLREKLVRQTEGLEEDVQRRLEKLEQSHLKYQDLYESIQDLVFLVDSDGLITKVNSHTRTLLNRSQEELFSTDIRQIISAENDEEWFENLLSQLKLRAAAGGIQLNLQTAPDSRLEVEMSASMIEIDGRANFQLVLRDISSTKSMERKLIDSQRLIDTSRHAAIFGLAKLAECRDNDTGAHLSRIRTYSRILAEELAHFDDFKDVITDIFIEDLYHSSVLHDIGKVGIPDSILLKPGKLTVEEFEKMKLHTVFGCSVLFAAERSLDSLSFLYIGQEIARSHHEKWDSTGYPDGLQGDDIPLAARIISLADVYDALTSARVYKPPFSHEESKEIILEQSNKQFDPRIIEAFLRREHDFKETRIQLVLQQPEMAND
ncbi:HD-GYP domain-containing protein [Desulfosediminicola flagellatus]|uniref:HD-GYP domain-containing protein n=1 Tax=Desulfosediminicola flagellatus TaxID=2569541 RepID=UPI00142EA363|nr:HD domain-containing phosphohydrolase [Desulfosediminicola flagellatus]